MSTRMASPESKTPGTSRSLRILALLLALLGALSFAVRGYHDEHEALHFRDFKQPYSSARCILKGCDPYDESATHQVFLAAGGQDTDAIVFAPYSALYPPFSLALLTPIAALSYPLAHAVWEGLLATLFSVAVVLVADLCAIAGAPMLPTLLLAAFAFSSTILLMLGQISGAVISLLAIGFCCLLRDRWRAIGVVCLFAAVMLKPHDAALPLMYLLLAGPRWRRSFTAVAMLSILFVIGSTLWFALDPHTVHWFGELVANLHGNAAAGSVNNPANGHIQSVNLADLQAIFAVVRDVPSLYNTAAVLCSLLLFGLWLVPVARLRPSLGKHLLAFAGLCCLTLLPIYHRQYDTRIFLLVFPAMAFLLGRKGNIAWGAVGFLILTAATVFTGHKYINHLLLQRHDAIVHAGAGQTLLSFRPIPEIVLLLTCFLIAALFHLWREERRATEPPTP